jgi:hypothetical protein
MTRPVLLLELNEVNFDFVQRYGSEQLPTLVTLIERHGLSHTTSENRYEHLEPWIQWVTAHTGRSLADHGVFRLGDIVQRDIPQIWEELEALGLKVGAISPMNAKHRLRDPAFFVPDPWTNTKVTGSPTLLRLHCALSQVVNENATGALTVESALGLLRGLLVYARAKNYSAYLSQVVRSRSRPWLRAAFLDLLLADVFIGEVRKTRPHFASLFLNGAAHIQHHYLFCARVYDGSQRNPHWYVDPRVDPILDIYRQYDHIVRQVMDCLPNARLMIATGLHQEPHESLTFYWRLRDHSAFLRRIGLEFSAVRPLMSRDFIVECSDESTAKLAQARLADVKAKDGMPIFEIDNRGKTLFVALAYPREISAGFEYYVAGEKHTDFDREVAFVALKNGEHDGVGYFIDTGSREQIDRFPLSEIPSRIGAALDVPLRMTRAQA